jgi:hypothetical protein
MLVIREEFRSTTLIIGGDYYVPQRYSKIIGTIPLETIREWFSSKRDYGTKKISFKL